MGDTPYLVLTGDPGVVKTKAQAYRDFAELVIGSTVSLDKLANESTAISEAIGAVRELSGTMKEDIKRTATLYKEAGGTLLFYGSELELARNASNTAAQQIESLEQEITNLTWDRDDAQTSYNYAKRRYQEAKETLAPEDYPVVYWRRERDRRQGVLSNTNAAINSKSYELDLQKRLWESARDYKDNAALAARNGLQSGFNLANGPLGAYTAAEIELAKVDAARAAELMRNLAVSWEELLALLAANSGNQAFADALAKLVSPQELANILAELATLRSSLIYEIGLGSRPPEDLTAFDAKYDKLLDELGKAYSMAARAMSPEQLKDFANQFVDAVGYPEGFPQPLWYLSLVIGRGAWPDQFLTIITDAILAAGPRLDFYGDENGLTVIDPSGDPMTGGPIKISDPLAGIFRSAASYSLGWMVKYFNSGDLVDLELPGYSYDDGKSAEAATALIDSRLKQVLLDWGLDQASAGWFFQAAANASLYESQFLGSDDFSLSLLAGTEYLERNSEILDHMSLWDKHKHEILGAIGMAIGVAMICTGVGTAPGWVVMSLAVADAAVMAVDAYYYFQEGNNVNAWINIGFILLPIAVGGVLRWLKVTKAEAELLIHARRTVAIEGVEVTPEMLDDALKAVDPKRATVGDATPVNTSAQFDALQTARDTAVATRGDAVADLKTARDNLIQLGVDPKDIPKTLTVDTISDTGKTLKAKYPDLEAAIDELSNAAIAERGSLTGLKNASEDLGQQSTRDLLHSENGSVMVDGTKWPDGTKQASGANTFDTIGLSADGKTLEILEAKGGSSELSKTGRIIGEDNSGNPIRAEQGSTDYLNDLLQNDKNLKKLLERRPDIAEGLRNGTIKIRYRVVKAPGDGTASVADLFIDNSRIDYSFAGG